jgi:hypothetical protein
MSISQNFPEERPSLNLNFAGSRTLDPRITFSRTSSATRVNGQGLIEVVPANTPRFDHSYDPVSGTVKSLGLLIEEQRTNRVTNNEDLSLWKQNFNPTLNSNDTVSPDGNTTADKVTQTNQVFTGVSTDMSGITTNTVYSCSVFIKPDGDTTTRFGFFDTSNWQGALDTDWSSGEPSTNGSLGGASDIVYEEYPNGWYRASFKASTQSNAFAGTVSFHCHPDRTGTGKSAWFWGAQLEEGAFPTSYIPTSASTATRTPDNASMEGDNFSDWYNQSEGSIFMQSSLLDVGNTGGKVLWSINQVGGFGEGFYMVNENNQTSITINAYYGGSNQAQFGGPTGITTNQYHKIIFSYQENNVNACFDGTVGIADTSVGIATVGRLVIGNNAWGSILNPGDCHISQLTYYPRRLTDDQLQNLTK